MLEKATQREMHGHCAAGKVVTAADGVDAERWHVV